MKIVPVAVASALMISSAFADTNNHVIKTRLDKLSGTPLVLVISFLPSEITSITCDEYTLVGLQSWSNQNNLTIPAADHGAVAAVAIIDASHYQGYCAKEGSIVAHTDDGDFVGHLDRGAGNWKGSTKLTFQEIK